VPGGATAERVFAGAECASPGPIDVGYLTAPAALSRAPSSYASGSARGTFAPARAFKR